MNVSPLNPTPSVQQARSTSPGAAPDTAPQPGETFQTGSAPLELMGRVDCPQPVAPTTKIAPCSAAELKQTVRALNNFSLDLHRELAADAKDDNFFASPFNVNGCLGMVLAGAKG